MSQANESLLLLQPDRYITLREQYTYNSPDCIFEVFQTRRLNYTGRFVGIFSSKVPSESPQGINLRRFENIIQEIFQDCYNAYSSGQLTNAHVKNLKQISSAIVYWKMASQGGRAKLKVENLKAKWTNDTPKQLLDAYIKKEMALFRIGGVRIPTATAFMRFLFPDDFGIMDSRVVGKYTQPEGITTLSIRYDGYINDTKQNVIKYEREYIEFLRKEAELLNKLGVKFRDVNSKGEGVYIGFRPCDIEMALF